MPDLTILTARMCSTNEGWEHVLVKDSVTSYTVRYEITPKGPYQYGYTCTCPAFKFGKGSRYKGCKHIHSVKHHHCRYGHEALIGSPTEMGDNCPRCGSPTVAVDIGV